MLVITAPTTSTEARAQIEAAGAGHRLGSLSEAYKSGGRGPGTISTGKGDPGGLSYGLYQMSTKAGTMAEFLASPQFAPWRAEFSGLMPGTKKFDDTWRRVAEQDTTAFSNAHHSFIENSKYEPVIRLVQEKTGIDLDKLPDAIRDVMWSASVQHGRAAKILIDAVNSIDQRVSRSNPECSENLINEIYDERSKHLEHLVNNFKNESTRQQFMNIVDKRYPNKRRDALTLLGN